MPHRVELAPAARRDLRRVRAQVRGLLESAILSLEDEPRPRGTRKIQGTEHTFRIRVGAYRVVFDVFDADKLIVVHEVTRWSETTYRPH